MGFFWLNPIPTAESSWGVFEWGEGVSHRMTRSHVIIRLMTGLLKIKERLCHHLEFSGYRTLQQGSDCFR
jgi:hypothetical protein